MYLLRPGEDSNHPVNRLLEDLMGARRRNVPISIYLNTKFKGQDPRKLIEGPWFDRLREAGIEMKLVSPVRRLHDKLLIVDRRYVVEGSMNWSIAALADNLESATVIDSPELAEAKLRRISFFPIWDEEEKKVMEKEPVLFPAGPPTSIEVPVALLEKRKFFPKMITTESERAMKIFLLLLYLAESKGVKAFSFSLEALSDYLAILRGKDRSSKRRQIIRVLRDLQNLYHLLKPHFRHGKDAYVELLFPPGPTFTLGADMLDPAELPGLDDNQIFLRLIRAKLRAEGSRFEDMSEKEKKARFFVHPYTYRRTLTRARKVEQKSSLVR